MGNTFNIQEAKTHLSRLVERVAAGEDIVIARAGKPVARLTQVEAAADEGPRQPGMFPMLVVPDAFFDPLPAEELSFWE
jgi:prevent-host-death family protein